jgi:hypothetical protein
VNALIYRPSLSRSVGSTCSLTIVSCSAGLRRIRTRPLSTVPDEVILDRFPNRHTTFGVSIHRCLGSHIVRVELTTMVSRVLARMPDYRIDHDSARRDTSIGVINGWINAPANFTPGKRLSDESCLVGSDSQSASARCRVSGTQSPSAS